MQSVALFVVLACTVGHLSDIVIMEVSVLILILVNGVECHP